MGQESSQLSYPHNLVEILNSSSNKQQFIYLVYSAGGTATALAYTSCVPQIPTHSEV